MVLAKRKQEQELLRTRVLVEAALAPHVEKKGGGLSEAFSDYMDAMFPFLRGTRTAKEELARQALKQWTDRGPLRVKPLWDVARGSTKRFHSKLRKGAERVAQIEAERKAGKRRRIG